LAVVNVADCANVYVRLITFKLCLCHFAGPLILRGQKRPGPTSRAMYLEMDGKSSGAVAISETKCKSVNPHFELLRHHVRA
ncbi:MAG: hypothetical protein ACSHXW_03465, partial [Yoonia sp.]